MPELLDDLLDDQSDRWSNGSPRLVEGYLAESARLSGDTEQVLDLIYHEVLLRQRAGESPELAEYVRRFPKLHPQLRVHFAVHEVLESSGGWAGDGQTEPQSGSPSPAGPPALPSRVGRFELLRFHARGGLGEVFVARDGELPREVAFKRLQPRHAQDADSRARFVREAEITSRLDHPSIVPVYGLLHDDAGRPGYAMRLIQGESMSVAIGRLYGSAAGPAAAAERQADEAGDVADRGEVRPALSAGQRRLALHRLLGRFAAACHAVAYAHSQGVLHRDLKPANIMLGPYGETLVIDWGLAREVSAERAVGEPFVPLDLGVSCVETRPGELLGTPAFMSPEQAAGDWKRVGPASDIYSLGATLYAILTGTTPFADTEPRKLLASVRQGQFPPPRQRRPDVPGALEAVCLRALALRPEDRYATAQALADDIDRWLADEPVTARRPPWTERLARWIRRRPAWVHAGFTALLVATIAAVVLQFAHDRAGQAEQVARQRQYLSAVATFHGALGEANFTNTVFTTFPNSTQKLRLDNGTEPFQAPFSDSAGYLAEEDLGQLAGMDPRGEWTLAILDSVADVAGTLQDWSLKLNGTDHQAKQASVYQPSTWNEYHVDLGRDDNKEVSFGNYQLSTINGFKFADIDGDGTRQSTELGLGGTMLFVDMNDNGTRDRGEPRATTLFDDVQTEFNEAGYFSIGSVKPGTYMVREELSAHYRQTVPADDGISNVTPIEVTLQSGATIGHSVRDLMKTPEPAPAPGLIFANQPLGEIHGRKWEDRNRNGQWDPGEPGLPGVAVYADLNHNGQLDAGEPSAVTMADDPATLQINEAGRYQLPNLPAGAYEIRELGPAGYVQTAGGSKVLYRNTFEGPTVGPEWSVGSVQRTPYGSRGGLGTFDNDTATLNVAGVPDNANVTVSFDLYVLGSWNGNISALAGNQDRFQFQIDGVTQVDTTFSNLDGFSQSFPDGLGGNHPARTGADEVDTLGFGTPADRVLDSIYHFEFTHAHGTGDLVLDFAASGLLNISDVLSAQWGLDNVVVTTPADFHEIEIGPGEVVGHVDFGNRRIGGEIHGEKSEDANGNGVRDPGEPGVAGVRIYIDANGNGAWDPDETRTFTVSDDPETRDIDETGRYWLAGLPAGQYVVREVVPAGSQQTFAGSRVVYQSDFQSGVAGSEWSDDGVSVAPAGGRRFLSLLDNQTVTLQLGDLPAHQRVSVSADLYVVGSWDGNHPFQGRDRWQMRGDGQLLVNTTFSSILDDGTRPPTWQNPVERTDVDNDGVTVPLDVLILVNVLNTSGSGPLGVPATDSMFLDVDNDGVVSPQDALIVMNSLNLLEAASVGAGSDGRYPQDYPDSNLVAEHPARTGAIENNTLGYGAYDLPPGDPRQIPMDSGYALQETFLHTGNLLRLDFEALGLVNQDQVAFEKWGLDNVFVSLFVDAHQVDLGADQVVEGVDFGNRRSAADGAAEDDQVASANPAAASGVFGGQATNTLPATIVGHDLVIADVEGAGQDNVLKLSRNDVAYQGGSGGDVVFLGEAGNGNELVLSVDDQGRLQHNLGGQFGFAADIDLEAAVAGIQSRQVTEIRHLSYRDLDAAADDAVTIGAGLLDLGGGSLTISAGTITVSGAVRAAEIDLQAVLLDNAAELSGSGTAGGRVSITAERVLNSGRIAADGTAGAGGEISILVAARLMQTESGAISASGVGGSGGRITILAGAGSPPAGSGETAVDGVFLSGTVRADGRGDGAAGGEITISGPQLDLYAAQLLADGDAGGGRVLVGWVSDPSSPSRTALESHATKTVTVNHASLLSANAVQHGSGGQVMVWSDAETTVAGRITARGGADVGDGGVVEVSSLARLAWQGQADVSAPAGQAGSVLLDPKNITVARLAFDEFIDPNPAAGNPFGAAAVPLSTGNVVVTSPYDNFGGTDAGAVYLFSGPTGALISTLRGSTGNDYVGSGDVLALSNGNYVVSSRYSGGAVTWGSGTTGISGVVSSSNSLVGLTGDASLQTVVTDDVNGTFFARFVNEAGTTPGGGTYGGRVRVGSQSGGLLASQAFASQAAQSVVLTPAVSDTLNTGSAVTLQANTDVAIRDAVTADNPSGNGGNLTLQAGRSVLVDADLTTDNGNLTLTANDTVANGVVDAQRDAGNAVVTMAGGTSLNVGTGTLTVALRQSTDKTDNARGVATLQNVTAASTVLNEGTVLANGTVTGPVTVNSGAVLGGTGTVTGTVQADGGGTLAPGAGSGILNTGGVTFSSGSAFDVELNGLTAGSGYDQLNVTGTVALFDGNLNVTLGYAPADGDSFTIIDNDAADPVTGLGTFQAGGASIPSGSSFWADGNRFVISYTGGTGNDVVLTVQNFTTELTLDGSGNLVVTDIASGGKDDTLTIQSDAANSRFIVSDPQHILGTTGVPGATGGGTHTVEVPWASLTGSQILVNTLGGNDSLTVDFAAGNFAPAIVYDGGLQTSPPGDSLTLSGGTFPSGAFTFIDDGSGTVNLTGNSPISYTGLEPIVTTGLTIDDVLFTFTGGAETITLTDAPGANLTIGSTLGESVTFANPAGSLRIQTDTGSGADTIDVEGLDAAFDADLIIQGDSDDVVDFRTSPTDLGSGDLSVTAQAIATSVAVSTAGGHVSLTASNGVALGDTLSSGGGQVDIEADRDADGTGTFTILAATLGGWAEQAKLTASEQTTGDYFGRSVAISGDTAVVGAMEDDSHPGAAYVFTRTGDTWTEQTRLTAFDGTAGDYFGCSVAISGDTVVVGAYGDDGYGSAYVFARTDGIWTWQDKLTARDGKTWDLFGWSVAISGDTVVVGEWGGNGPIQGSAYVFTRSGSSWIRQDQLVPSDGALWSDYFGWSVAISGDTAVVGKNGENNGQGSAYVFTRSSGTWTQQDKLVANDGEPSRGFGKSVAVSGETVVVGADGWSAHQGSAYVFARNGGTWTQQQKLAASDGSNGDSFGLSVAISGDMAVGGRTWSTRAARRTSSPKAAVVPGLSRTN